MLGLPVGKFLKISPRSSTIRDRDGDAPLSERDLVEPVEPRSPKSSLARHIFGKALNH